MARQKANGYGRRALVETAIARLKRRGGDRLTARTFGARCQEVAFRVSAANKAIRHARPITIRAA